MARTGRRTARPRPVRIDGRDYLTTAQVAAYLGVRTQTVYAYVSRGVLARTTIRGQRGSFFALADVEDVATRARAPRAPGSADRIHTQVTLVDPDGRLAYRGVDVPALVLAGGGFVDACAVLWERDAPDRNALPTPPSSPSPTGDRQAGPSTSDDAPPPGSRSGKGGREGGMSGEPGSVAKARPDVTGRDTVGSCRSIGGTVTGTFADGSIGSPVTGTFADGSIGSPVTGTFADGSIGSPVTGTFADGSIGSPVTGSPPDGSIGGVGLGPSPVAVARSAVAALPAGTRTVDRVRIVVDVLGATDPLRGDLRPEAVVAVGARIIDMVTAVLAEAGEEEAGERPEAEAVPVVTSSGRAVAKAGRVAGSPPSEVSAPGGCSVGATSAPQEVAARLRRALAGEGWRPDAGADRLVDAALALLADHDLAMSTRAARVAASARAHPYAVVASALAALDSPLHGTAPRAAHRILGDVLADVAEGGAATIADLVSGARPAAGFGHRIYREADPRAETLLRLLRESGRAPEVLAAVDPLVDAMIDRRGAYPNSDVALAALVHALGLRAEAGEVIFAVARIAGWIAHALEEYAAEPLRYRLAGVYTGVRPTG